MQCHFCKKSVMNSRMRMIKYKKWWFFFPNRFKRNIRCINWNGVSNFLNRTFIWDLIFQYSLILGEKVLFAQKLRSDPNRSFTVIKAQLYQLQSSNNVNLQSEEKMEGKRSNTQPLTLLRKIKGNDQCASINLKFSWKFIANSRVSTHCFSTNRLHVSVIYTLILFCRIYWFHCRGSRSR